MTDPVVSSKSYTALSQTEREAVSDAEINSLIDPVVSFKTILPLVVDNSRISALDSGFDRMCILAV